MDNEAPRRALLLGLVEVTRPVKDLDEKARATIFALCHTASTSGHVEDSGWLGWRERGLMGVEIVLDQQHLHVTCDDILVTRHNLAEVCPIMIVQKTEGHVVFIGHCLVKEVRLAVVLDMMSELDAHRLVKDIRLRLSRLEPLPVHLSAPQDSRCSGPLAGTSSHTCAPDSTALSHGPPPIPTKPVLPWASAAWVPPDAEHPVASMPDATTLVNTPLLLISRSPVSLVPTRPIAASSVSPRPATAPQVSPRPATAPQVSPRPATAPQVSPRPATAPQVSPRPATAPEVSPRPATAPQVSPRPATAPQVSPRPATAPEVSPRPATAPQVSPRPATAPQVSPRPATAPQVSPRPVTAPPVSSRPVTAPPVSSRPVTAPPACPRPVTAPPACPRPVTAPPVCPRPVTAPPVCPRPVTAPPVCPRPVTTRVVSTPAVSTQSMPTPPDCTPPVSTLLASTSTVFTPPISNRPVPLAKVLTPLVAVLNGSSTSMSTSTVSTPSVSTPSVSTQPVAHTKVFTPLVSITTATHKTVSTSVSVTPLRTPSASTRPMLTQFGSTPRVFTLPVSFPSRAPTPAASTPTTSTPTTSAPAVSIPAASIPAASIPAASIPAASIPAASIPAASIPAASTPAASTPAASTPAASTPPVSTQSVSTNSPVAAAVPVVSIVSVQDPHRLSLASSSSHEEDEYSGFQELEFILKMSKVDDSERLITPDLKPQEQEGPTSLEQMLCNFLKNEHEYLNTLGRIRDTRTAVKSELQQLLRRSDRLVDFHEDLYRDLFQEFPSCAGITRVFLSRKEDLEQYRYYLMDAPQVACKLTEEVTGQYPTLEADIKSSWKRLHFYFMTFEKLATIVPAEEQPLVQELVEVLREMNRQGDSGILIDAVTRAPFSLHTLGTPLLHGLFTIKDSSGRLSSRIKYHVLFFKEMMVITLPKKNKYQYKDHLPVRQLNLLHQNSDEATFVLELVQGGEKKNRKYTFRPRQQEAKDAWVKEISRLRLEYAKEVMRQNKLRFGYQ